MRKVLRNLFGVGALGLALGLGTAQAAQAKDVAPAPVSNQKLTLGSTTYGPYSSYEAAKKVFFALARQGFNVNIYQANNGYWYVTASRP
jgi:hypothetical protein